MTKKEIVVTGKRMGVDYDQTWSCYTPDPKVKPCNKCHACLERNKVL